MTPGSALATAAQPIPWRAIFQRLSLAYHWTPDEILALTPVQLALYLQDDIEQDGAVAMSVQEGVEYVARRRAARETWVDEVLDRLAPAQRNNSAPRAPQAGSPSSLTMRSALETPVSQQSLPHVIRQVASSRVDHRADLVPAGTQAGRITVQQHAARRTDTPASMRPGVVANNSSPAAAGRVERTAHRLRDTAAGKLDELSHRVEMIAQSTRQTQAAIERLERRRNDAAQFS